MDSLPFLQGELSYCITTALGKNIQCAWTKFSIRKEFPDQNGLKKNSWRLLNKKRLVQFSEDDDWVRFFAKTELIITF